jgi:glycosyltransferase involved in cell wall biosynthesis
MLISVVIPTFNRHYCLKNAIYSVLNQTYKNLELIIVDDCSTDKTKQLIQNFSDKRIKYILLPENKGAANSRNVGINIASGKYVCFLDSDDEWNLNKLEYQLSVMGDADASFSDCQYIAKNFISTNNSSHYTTERDFLLGCHINPGSSLIVKRSIFEIIGLFDHSLRRLEDWDWLIRFYAANLKMVHVKEPLAKVTVNNNKNFYVIEKDLDYFFKKNINFFSKSDLKKIKSGIFIEKSGNFFRTKKYINSIAYSLIAIYYSKNCFSLLFHIFFNKIRFLFKKNNLISS